VTRRRSPRARAGVDRGRPEPLYHQLETELRERILSGEWPPGTQIPTEQELGQRYGVSRITVRQAVRNLVDSGYLERGQGRGTFVREPVLVAGERGLRSFSEEMRALALQPGARVLDARKAPADGVVAEHLGLEVGAPVHRLRRLRTGDGRPIGLQTAHLPVARFPGLDERIAGGGSLYEVLASTYGVELDHARETFAVERLPADVAELLDVAAGEPAFHVERVAYDAEGPFEYTVSLMRGDRYRIQWVLRPGGPDPDQGDDA
jgi:GntR family transcriptional regulator